MLLVTLLTTVATASGLLLYDRLQPPAASEAKALTSRRNARPKEAAPTESVALVAEQARKGVPPPEQPPAVEPKTASGEPKRVSEAPKTPPKEPKPVPEEPKTAPQEPQPAPVVDAAKRGAFRRAISMARQAIGRRDFAGAKRHLKTAEANGQDADDDAELGRLESLLGNLEEFWEGMRKVVAGLVPAEEILLGQTPIIVVQVDAKQLTVRSEGRNHTYRIYDLPRPIVEALVQSRFVKHPSTDVLLGTYMAMDPNGDRERAEQLWREAARQGEDVRDLMLEISPEAAATLPRGASGRKPGS
jgi:hypothetical protein